jgi:hypothetical protein
LHTENTAITTTNTRQWIKWLLAVQAVSGEDSHFVLFVAATTAYQCNFADGYGPWTIDHGPETAL